MPASYRIYADLRFVHTIASGALSGREMLAHATALAADAHFDRDYAQLVDFRPVTAFDALPAEIRQLADRNPFAANARRVALVGTAVAFGMLRMYQLLTDTEESGSLVTYDEAEAWAFIGRSPPAPDVAPASSWKSS
jgi:hypothetical protein